MKKQTTLLLAALLISGCITPEQETTTTTTSTTLEINEITTSTSSTIITSVTSLPVFSGLVEYYTVNPTASSRVLVFLKDSSGNVYSSNQTDEEKFRTYLNRKQVNKEAQKTLLSEQKQQGLIIAYESYDGSWFSADVNNATLYNLARDSRVEYVWPWGYDKNILKREPQISWDFLKGCTSKDECTYVAKNCCNSEHDSINEKFREYYEGKLSRECSWTTCPAIALCLSCMDIEVDCLNNKCTLTKFEPTTTTTTLHPTSNGYITGIVTPANSGIKVDLLKNSSLFRTTNTSEHGRYFFFVPSGDYALEFTYKDIVYIYNDETNSELYSGIHHNINIKSDNSTSYNINLSSENPDFKANTIQIIFKEGVTDDEINQIVQSLNSEIVNRWDFSTIKITKYEVRTPIDKTIFEMKRLFESNNKVKSVTLDKMATG
jgi:hypothetical protein